jgi:hypothetical protein
MQAHNIQINAMQQPIVMNECMNRKNEDILRILMQETWKMVLWIESYGYESFGGLIWSFQMVLGVFTKVLRGWKLRRERIGALAKFGKFSGVFGGFLGCLEWLGPNPNYFSKTEGPAAILPMSRDHRLIYKKLGGFFVKFVRFNRIRIISQR